MAPLPLLGKGRVVVIPVLGSEKGEQMEACKTESEEAEGGEGVKNKQKVTGGKKGSRKKSSSNWEGKRRRECGSGRWKPLDGSLCSVKSSGVCRLASWRY